MKHLQVTDDEMLPAFHGTISLNVEIHFLDFPLELFQANIYILNFKKMQEGLQYTVSYSGTTV